ncbi:hypothetical protein ACM01_36370 [Streptomyces viridochromogenes]|uniref:Uncharacterized protein n=1 Tax=Streptomyces viridochromogenes TaxID=1938 RepID=A0A0J8BU24_STRVR|nr:hypothetical protein ACM01_36370 [Streptomyces viridochromogenes]
MGTGMSGVDDSEEPPQPDDPVMATFRDWLDHALTCVHACRLEGVACLHSMRLSRRHREARRAARTTGQRST